jgi:hypothetical protein
MICYFINEAAPGLPALRFDAEWGGKGSPDKAVVVQISHERFEFQAWKGVQAYFYVYEIMELVS